MMAAASSSVPPTAYRAHVSGYHLQHLRQYLYLCTSKASKVSTLRLHVFTTLRTSSRGLVSALACFSSERNCCTSKVSTVNTSGSTSLQLCADAWGRADGLVAEV
jgi:hypothetical protein